MWLARRPGADEPQADVGEGKPFGGVHWRRNMVAVPNRSFLG